MDIKVIKNKDVMTTEDLVNIKGGLNESLDSIATTCTCDCFIGCPVRCSEKQMLKSPVKLLI